MIFHKIPEFSKDSEGTSLKARGLIQPMIYLSSYLTPVKTEFARPSKKVDFRGDDDCHPLLYSLDNTSYLVSPQISQYSYFLRPISSNPLSPYNFLSQTIGIYFTQSYIFCLVKYKLMT